MSDLNKPWLALNDDEHVVTYTHPSWWKFLWAILFGVAMILMGFYGLYEVFFGEMFGSSMIEWIEYGSYTLILLGVVFILIEIFKRSRMYYVVTNERVLSKVSVINVNPDYLPIEAIQEKNVRQSTLKLETALGFGHIFFATAATAGKEMRLSHVPRPYEFIVAVEEAEDSQKSPTPEAA